MKALLGLLLPATAFADEPTAVLLGIEGYNAERLEAALAVELDRVVSLLPRDDVRFNAEEIGADLSTEDGLVKLAEGMGIDLFVRGEVKGKGARARTKIVLVGPDGLVAATVKGASPKTKRAQRAIAKRAAKAAKRTLDRLEAADADVEGSDELDVALPDEEVAGDPAPAQIQPIVADAPKLKTIEPKEDEPEPAVLEAAAEAAPDDRSRRVFVAEIGLAVRARSAKVELTDGREARHSTGPFPEIAVLLEAAPFSSGPLEGAFAAAELGIEAGLSSIDRDTDVKTSAVRFLGEVGYVFHFGLVDLGAAVGFGVDRIALSENRVLDSTTYSYVSAGALGRLTLLDGGLVIRAGGSLRPVVSTGALGDRWAQSASAFGFAIGGGLAGRLNAGFIFGADVEFGGYMLHFSTPERIGGNGGFDSSLIVTLHAGWAF